MTIIVKAVQTCYAMPSAWDVWTDEGRYLHFKYRYGVAKVFRETTDKNLVLDSALTLGDRLDGFIGLADFCTDMGFTLALQEPYTPLPDPNADYEPEQDSEDAALSIRAQVLREAESLVVGDREEQYGHPRDNLKRIAEFWNDYLYPIMQAGDLLEPKDVALMMILVKVAREQAGHKRDSLVDIAGYAAIAAEVAEVPNRAA